jgi:uracil-DNA glycosylase
MTQWPKLFSEVVGCGLCDKAIEKCMLRDVQDNVPQPGYVGKKYLNKRVLLVGQNPGVGNSVSEARSRAYLQKLREIRDTPNLNVFSELQEILANLIPTWPVHGNYFPLEEAGLKLDEIAHINLVRCRTCYNGKSTVGMINNCSMHFEKWIKQLNPKVIVFVGKWASDNSKHLVNNHNIPNTFVNRNRSLSGAARQQNLNDVARFVREQIG